MGDKKARKKIYGLLGIMVMASLVIAFSTSCQNDTPLDKEHNQSEDAQEVIVEEDNCFDNIDFTDEEKAYIEKLKERGEIRIAIRDRIGVFYEDEEGNKHGIHYGLAKNFADDLGVKLDIKLVQFENYFEKGGLIPETVKTDDTLFYTPDLLNEVDLYCDSLTALPWREKLFDFVEIYPVRQIVVNRTGEEIKSIEGIFDKKMIVLKDSSYEERLKDIEKEYGIEFDIDYNTDAMSTYTSVSEGTYDITISDSDLGILTITKYDNLSLSVPVGDYEYIGWGVSKEDKMLNSILSKYIGNMKGCGFIDQLWAEEYNMTFIEYSELLGIIEN